MTSAQAISAITQLLNNRVTLPSDWRWQLRDTGSNIFFDLISPRLVGSITMTDVEVRAYDHHKVYGDQTSEIISGDAYSSAVNTVGGGETPETNKRFAQMVLDRIAAVEKSLDLDEARRLKAIQDAERRAREEEERRRLPTVGMPLPIGSGWGWVAPAGPSGPVLPVEPPTLPVLPVEPPTLPVSPPSPVTPTVGGLIPNTGGIGHAVPYDPGIGTLGTEDETLNLPTVGMPLPTDSGGGAAGPAGPSGPGPVTPTEPKQAGFGITTAQAAVALVVLAILAIVSFATKD